ncbi:MAG: RNA-processing protein [Candidatus Aenigmarchaeota archaeon]|nr:RNA-processing protein [Candidatus Aenigmarchaeota archaeon]
MMEHLSIPKERLAILRKSNVWKERLKEFLDVGVDIKEDVEITGDLFQVLRVKEILKAFGRGFLFEETLDLLDEDYFLDIIDISQFAGKSKKRQSILIGRVIGEGGVTKKMIEKLSMVKIAIYGKTVSIIGKPENIKIARGAVEMILFGSKHNSVYRFLKENKVV